MAEVYKGSRNNSTYSERLTNQEIERIVAEIRKEVKYENDNNITKTLLFKDYTPNNKCKIVVSETNKNSIKGYHSHDFYEINYAYEGDFVQYIDGDIYLQKSGQIIIFGPGIYHTMYPLGKSKAINILIESDQMAHLEAQLYKADKNNCISHAYRINQYLLLQNDTNEDLKSSIALAYREFHNGGELACSIVEYLTKILLTKLCKCKRIDKFSTDDIADKDYFSTAEKIVNYIQDNYSDVSLEILSKKFVYSKNHIYRIIKEHTGNSFSQLVMSCKIENSKRLLANADNTISKVAQEIGVGSSEHFCRIFKKYCGITPTQYKAKCSQQHNNK